ncbi:YolD-like family protein [Chryseomicrobium sp. FSL W7-1435]|uniref:YolD-like family protein n=1 Tax=Chryseomicrobium sp. FSL W7-1435 TaxID=2921704 RepID=UPI0031599C98
MERPDPSRIRDRGKIKWTAMMLPEHVAIIRDYIANEGKVKRPELDEWDLRHLEESIGLALAQDAEVKLKYWRNGEFHIRGGKIKHIDAVRRQLYVEDPFNTTAYALEDIVDVTLLD